MWSWLVQGRVPPFTRHPDPQRSGPSFEAVLPRGLGESHSEPPVPSVGTSGSPSSGVIPQRRVGIFSVTITATKRPPDTPSQNQHEWWGGRITPVSQGDHLQILRKGGIHSRNG